MAGKGELVDRFFDVGDGVFAIAAQPAPRLADPNPSAAMMGTRSCFASYESATLVRSLALMGIHSVTLRVEYGDAPHASTCQIEWRMNRLCRPRVRGQRRLGFRLIVA